MAEPDVKKTRIIHFSIFELDLKAGELRRNGTKVKIQEQPFQILAALLERPGEVVTREELRNRLWPADTFVDFDHGLNAAIKRLRDALGESAETPVFVETLARRGYRFIAPITVNGTTAAAVADAAENPPITAGPTARTGALRALALLGAVIVLAVAGLWIFERRETPAAPSQRTLTRITFDEGLQNEPTWSPDG